jgi:hypothetical protein
MRRHKAGKAIEPRWKYVLPELRLYLEAIGVKANRGWGNRCVLLLPFRGFRSYPSGVMRHVDVTATSQGVIPQKAICGNSESPTNRSGLVEHFREPGVIVIRRGHRRVDSARGGYASWT